jgi:hypothetical protein
MEFLNVFALTLRGIKKRVPNGWEVIVKDNNLRKMFKLHFQFRERKPGAPLILESLNFYGGNMDGQIDNYQLNWIGGFNELFVTWEGKEQVSFVFMEGDRFVLIAVDYDLTLKVLTNQDRRREELHAVIAQKQMEQRRKFSRLDFN